MGNIESKVVHIPPDRLRIMRDKAVVRVSLGLYPPEGKIVGVINPNIPYSEVLRIYRKGWKIFRTANNVGVRLPDEPETVEE